MRTDGQTVLAQDPESYESMFRDMEQAGYQVDEYWRNLSHRNELVGAFSLNSFRDGRYSSYSGSNFKLKWTPRWAALRRMLQKAASLEHLLACRGYTFPFSVSREDVESLRNNYGETIFRSLHVKDSRIANINDSGLGRPADRIEVGGKTYTHSFLTFFHRFTVMNSLWPVREAEYFLEIGGAYGGQTEILLKLFPHMKVCLVEIPPQLYVAQQYLNVVFANQVIKYREVADIPAITRDTYGERRIIVMAPWQLGKIGDKLFDAMTNQFSFQEMSRATVETYCREIQRMVREVVFLFECREGHPAVNAPVEREHYIRWLAPRFILAETIAECLHEGVLVNGEKKMLHQDVYFFKAAGSTQSPVNPAPHENGVKPNGVH